MSRSGIGRALLMVAALGIGGLGSAGAFPLPSRLAAGPQTSEAQGPAAALVQEYGRTRNRAQANLDRREYSKLLDLLDEEELGDDRPFALLRACELASALGKWSAVLEHAAEIEKLAAGGLVRRQARLARARALAHGRGPAREMLDLYLGLATETPDRAAPLLLEAFDMMIGRGERDAAREALDRLEQTRPELSPYLVDRHAMLEQLGKPPATLEAKTTAGDAFSLADHEGKTVVLVFWAAWDPSSVALLGLLAEQEASSRGRLVVQGICVEPGDDPRYADWVTGSCPVAAGAPIMAPAGFADPIVQAFGVGSIPATRLVDADGKLAGVDLRPDALLIAIDRLTR